MSVNVRLIYMKYFLSVHTSCKLRFLNLGLHLYKFNRLHFFLILFIFISVLGVLL